MLSSWAGGNVPGRVWSSSQLGRVGSEHPTGPASPAWRPGDIPVRGSGCRVTLCVLQESRSPAGDAPEPRRSAFEPAVSGQEKLDFNRNLKEGKKGFEWPLGTPPAPFEPLVISAKLQDGTSHPVPWCRALGCAHLAVFSLSLLCRPRSLPARTVMPTIEKLLSSDWKERLLGRNTTESKEVKGEVSPRPPTSTVLLPVPCALAAWAGNTVFPTLAGGEMCLQVCVFNRDLYFFNQNINLIFWGVSIPDESLPLTAQRGWFSAWGSL